MKKLIMTALVSLAILPGCGKKNDEVAVNGVAVAAYGTATVGLQGSCFYIAGTAMGSGVTVTFSGNGAIGFDGGLTANLQGSSVGLPGVTHTRTNSAGDSMQVFVTNQTPGQGGTVYAVAYLAPGTADYFRYYNIPVCGIAINSWVASGTLTISSALKTQGWMNSGLSL